MMHFLSKNELMTKKVINVFLNQPCSSLKFMPFDSDGTQKELGIMLLEFGTQTENRYLITSSRVEKG
jgi:hypothetical protein